MPLRELPLRLSYRTGRNDMVGEFFVPCLEQSTLYLRSAGYFTSHGLALAARGVASLVARSGEMRLVVSPKLEPEDVEALQAAIDQPVGLLQSIAAKSMVDVEDALVRDRLNALAWLAAAGFLKVKLALRVDDAGEVARGIYHEKVGIFTGKNWPMVLIVVCPFINLCKQWLREMAGFGLNPVPCCEGRQRWESLMEEGYQRISAGLSKVHSIVHDFILQPPKLGCKPVSDLSLAA